jgi:WD40 repeat protein
MTAKRCVLLSGLLLAACAALAPGAEAQQTSLTNSKVVEAVPAPQILGGRGFRDRMELHSLAWSPDGKAIAAGNCNTPEAVVWDAASGKELRRLKDHLGGARAVAWSPDGKLIATGSNARQVGLFDAATGRLLRQQAGHTQAVAAVAFAPDGKALASAGHDGTVRLWDVARGGELQQLRGAQGPLQVVAISGDGKHVAAAGLRDRLLVWDAGTGARLSLPESITGAEGTSVALSPDGRLAAVGGADGRVHCWDLRTGEVVYRHESADASPWVAVALAPDGKSLAHAGADSRAHVIDIATRKKRLEFDAGQGTVRGLAFAPDGKTLATAGGVSVRLWDAATGQDRFPDEGHHSDVLRLAFSPDGKTLASGSEDRTARLWDVATGKELACLRGHRYGVRGLAFAPDGKTLAVGAIYPGRVLHVWDLAARKELHSDWSDGDLTHLHFTPDGASLIAAKERRSVAFWDVRTWKVTRRITHDSGTSPVALLDGGKVLAVFDGDGRVRLWDLAADKVLRTIEVGTAPGRNLTFSHDGKILAVTPTAFPNGARFVDVATGKDVAPLKGEAFLFAVFAPDGRRLLSSAKEDCLVWWDLATGREALRTTPRPLTSFSVPVAFSPDGRRLALGYRDGSVHLLDVAGALRAAP